MGKYTDGEIRAVSETTIRVAADYLGNSPDLLILGMRNSVLPIGFAVKKRGRLSYKMVVLYCSRKAKSRERVRREAAKI